jgi:hypothetical protein
MGGRRIGVRGDLSSQLATHAPENPIQFRNSLRKGIKMFRRRVWAVCDGPCGTVIEGGKAPKGWVYLRLQVPGNEAAQESAALCPECQVVVRAGLGRLKIALSKGAMVQEESSVAAVAAVKT